MHLSENPFSSGFSCLSLMFMHLAACLLFNSQNMSKSNPWCIRFELGFKVCNNWNPKIPIVLHFFHFLMRVWNNWNMANNNWHIQYACQNHNYLYYLTLFFLPITYSREQRLICATHDNFADTSDLSEWGFWHAVLLRKNMSCIKVQAIWSSAALKKIWQIQQTHINLVLQKLFWWSSTDSFVNGK